MRYENGKRTWIFRKKFMPESSFDIISILNAWFPLSFSLFLDS